MIVFFYGYSFDYNLYNFIESVNRTDYDVFKKNKIQFIHRNINSLVSKSEVRPIVKISNASVLEISEAKLDKTVWSSELEFNDYDLIRLDQSREGGCVTCFIKISIAYRDKDRVSASTLKVFLLTLICLSPS